MAHKISDKIHKVKDDKKGSIEPYLISIAHRTNIVNGRGFSDVDVIGPVSRQMALNRSYAGKNSPSMKLCRLNIYIMIKMGIT